MSRSFDLRLGSAWIELTATPNPTRLMIQHIESEQPFLSHEYTRAAIAGPRAEDCHRLVVLIDLFNLSRRGENHGLLDQRLSPVIGWIKIDTRP